jgi:hypothetical protein
VNFPQNWREELGQNGHFKAKLELSDALKTSVISCDWNALDAHFQKLTSPQAELFSFLHQFEDFKSIEFIISIRNAENPWEEDGIWHDDGSRKLAFSLFLNLKPQDIKGGILEIRKKENKESFKIPSGEMGEMIIFKNWSRSF